MIMQKEFSVDESPAIDTINAGEILKAVKYSVDSCFGKHVDPIIDFAKNTPAYSGNILEWHLDNKQGSFDFACRVNVDFDRTLIIEEPTTIGNSLLNNGCQYLINNNRAFRLGIENIWIEYDFPFRADPALFFDIHRNSNICLEEKVRSVHQVSRLFNCDLSAKLPELLKNINGQGLTTVYYGWMFGRRSRAIRLTIEGIQADRLTDTLAWLGWEGNYSVLDYLRKKYLNNLQKVVLAIDFDGQVGKRIGIEVFDKNILDFTKCLYSDEIIGIQELKLLWEWPGMFNLRPPLASALSNLHQRNIRQVYRRINHFKFILDHSGIITAKAYLYYCF